MIELDALVARAPPASLGPLSGAFGPGVFALLGAPDDGGPVVLDVLAARVRPKRGGARIAGAAPWAPATRRAVAHVPLDAVLRRAARGTWRRPGRRPRRQRLDELGLASLAPASASPRARRSARWRWRGLLRRRA